MIRASARMFAGIALIAMISIISCTSARSSTAPVSKTELFALVAGRMAAECGPRNRQSRARLSAG